MDTVIPPHAVVVTDSSFKSKDPSEIVASNIDYVNGLYGQYLINEEIAGDALVSYYTDYFSAQLGNGGFSQFVYNSRWKPVIVARVRTGLDKMGAKRHRELLDRGELLVASLGPRLETFFGSEYFDENPERDHLDSLGKLVDTAMKREDLSKLNAKWLRRLPNLTVVSVARMQAELERRGRELPDREERVARARAAEPRYMKILRALCEKAGQDLDRPTAGDFEEFEGVRVFVCHLVTNQGHHRMIDLGSRALMFKGRTAEIVAEITPSEDWKDE